MVTTVHPTVALECASLLCATSWSLLMLSLLFTF